MTTQEVTAEYVELGDVILVDRVAHKVEGSFMDAKGKVALQVGGRWRYFHRGQRLERMDFSVDNAEPEPDTVTVHGEAKCHHCAQRIRDAGDSWVHIESGKGECE